MKTILLVLGICVAFVFLWFIRSTMRLSKNRKRVMEQIGEKWYRLACVEIFSERGKNFLMEHFRETLRPDRVRKGEDPTFPPIAALAAYLRFLDEKGQDATRYDSLPVDREAVARARVQSRMLFPSNLAKDKVMPAI